MALALFTARDRLPEWMSSPRCTDAQTEPGELRVSQELRVRGPRLCTLLLALFTAAQWFLRACHKLATSSWQDPTPTPTPGSGPRFLLLLRLPLGLELGRCSTNALKSAPLSSDVSGVVSGPPRCVLVPFCCLEAPLSLSDVPFGAQPGGSSQDRPAHPVLHACGSLLELTSPWDGHDR